ncbi:MAG TPA: hypothetical protein VGI40_14485 [Pirellulaceae bacterium]
MFQPTIRDLLYFVVLLAIFSAWHAHSVAVTERQRTLLRLITKEGHESNHIESEWNQYAKTIPRQFEKIHEEQRIASDMNGLAQNDLIAVRRRLRALRVELPKQIDGREGGTEMSPDDIEDLKVAKIEYETLKESLRRKD